MTSTSRSRIGLAGAIFALAASAAFGQNPPVTVTVNTAAGRHPIDPRIYGVAYGSRADLAALNCPLNRSGGNATTQYNWALNASNRGQDWFFESIAGDSPVAGADSDAFIAESRAGGAQPMITLPMIGWVAKLGPNRGKLASFSIAKYGPQTGNDGQWFPDAGNGIRSGGGFVANDPNDANQPADSEHQRGWVRHLVAQWGTAAAGGVRYYLLDNEHTIWHATHRDVHPVGATMDELGDKMLAYAAMVKAEDPSALVVGPEEWGWSGYLYSGYDLQWGEKNGWSNLPDRAAHGGQDYLPWLLSQFKSREGATRLLDVFAVHYYPQGGEFSNDTGTSMQLRRNRSTRSLWDPSYVDETWVNDRVRLIRRLKEWTATYYRADTKVGITEYNWGAEGHINGATAQADVYGIFGREALDVGTRWTTPGSTTPTFKAMQMYRNYDGQRSTFGDTSVSATAPNPDQLAAFAAQRSTDGALTVMLVHKNLSGTTAVTTSLGGFQAGPVAQVFQLSASNAIQRLADVGVSGGMVSLTVPAQSVTLVVIPSAGSTPTPTATATPTPTLTATPRATPTATPRSTPTPTPSPTPRSTPTPTPTPTPLRTVSVSPTAAPEGHSGDRLFGFRVALSSASAQTVTVTYATQDGTATAPADYSARTGTLTFAPGQTERAVLVHVKGDTAVEPNETFSVVLTGAANAALGTATTTGTIQNDDPATAAALVEQWRLFHPVTHEHLYTPDAVEYQALGQAGWNQEGMAYRLFTSAGTYGGGLTVPYYRLYHYPSALHHWTSDATEVRVLADRTDYVFEGTVGFVLPTCLGSAVPLYRLVLPSPLLHLWTIEDNERNGLIARGWSNEGVVGCVVR